jgi:hypothetical protein
MPPSHRSTLEGSVLVAAMVATVLTPAASAIVNPGGCLADPGFASCTTLTCPVLTPACDIWNQNTQPLPSCLEAPSYATCLEHDVGPPLGAVERFVNTTAASVNQVVHVFCAASCGPG